MTYTLPDGFQITIVNEKEPKENVSEKTVFEEMLKNTEKNLEKMNFKNKSFIL